MRQLVVRQLVLKKKLCAEADLADGEAKVFNVEEYVLALVKAGGELYCLDDTCSHGAFSLGEGEVDGLECTLECPKHGSLFDLKTGEPISLPATKPVNCYDLLVENGEVYVELPASSES